MALLPNRVGAAEWYVAPAGTPSGHGTKASPWNVDGSAFLRRGDRFRLMDPRDFYGKPVLAGTYRGKPIRVPVAGEFAAFVVMKETRR